MSSTIEHQSRPGLAAVLDRARDALAARRRADRDLLVAAFDWAITHPASAPHDVAGWGEVDLYGEGFLPLAGAALRWSRSSPPASSPPSWAGPPTPRSD